MSLLTSDRRTAIADAAIRVLGEAGRRDLTHRRVDQELGVPAGTTANFFSTRATLLAACAERLADLDLADASGSRPAPPSGLVDADAVRQAVMQYVLTRLRGEQRIRQLARLELLLDSTRSEPLEDVFVELRTRFIDAVAGLLHAAGNTQPRSDARMLVACVDGLVFDQLLYPRTAVDGDDLHAQIDRLIAATLP